MRSPGLDPSIRTVTRRLGLLVVLLAFSYALGAMLAVVAGALAFVVERRRRLRL